MAECQNLAPSSLHSLALVRHPTQPVPSPIQQETPHFPPSLQFYLSYPKPTLLHPQSQLTAMILPQHYIKSSVSNASSLLLNLHKSKGATLEHEGATGEGTFKASGSLGTPNCSCFCGLHPGCSLSTLDSASERGGKRIKGSEQRRSFSSCFNPIFLPQLPKTKSWKGWIGHPSQHSVVFSWGLLSSLYLNDSSNGDSTIDQTLLFGKNHSASQLTFPSAHFSSHSHSSCLLLPTNTTFPVLALSLPCYTQDGMKRRERLSRVKCSLNHKFFLRTLGVFAP